MENLSISFEGYDMSLTQISKIIVRLIFYGNFVTFLVDRWLMSEMMTRCAGPWFKHRGLFYWNLKIFVFFLAPTPPQPYFSVCIYVSLYLFSCELWSDLLSCVSPFCTLYKTFLFFSFTGSLSSKEHPLELLKPATNNHFGKKSTFTYCKSVSVHLWVDGC